MKLHSLNCNNCGGLLQIPDKARFVTCSYCESQLAVKETEGARFTEAIEAIHERLDRLADQKELDLLDREWAVERMKYMIEGKHGVPHVPCRKEAWIIGAVPTVFGLLWSAGAYSMNVRSGGAFDSVFPLFGLLFAAAGVGLGFLFHRKAVEYEAAQERYFERRKVVMDRQREAARSRERTAREPVPEHPVARWADQDYSDLMAQDANDPWTRR